MYNSYNSWEKESAVIYLAFEELLFHFELLQMPFKSIIKQLNFIYHLRYVICL